MKEIISTGDRQLLGLIRSIERTGLVAQNARHQVSFSPVKPGAVVEIGGVPYLVEAIGTYTETSWGFAPMKAGDTVTEWRMRSLEDGGVRYFEWYEDDVIEAYLTEEELSSDPSRYGLRSWKEFLQDDGLDSSLTIRVNGDTFRYDDDESWAARYQGKKSGAEFVRCYEFVAERGNLGLTIEVWGKQGEQGVSLWLSREVIPASMKLIAKGSI